MPGFQTTVLGSLSVAEPLPTPLGPWREGAFVIADPNSRLTAEFRDGRLYGPTGHEVVPLARPGQLFVPVKAAGAVVLDNGGDPVCQCFTPELAAKIAQLLNADAGFTR